MYWLQAVKKQNDIKNKTKQNTKDGYDCESVQ
jgi:hypothetical protein